MSISRARERPTSQDYELKRQDIMNVASRLFAERGYANVAMREIAEATGLGKATLYHYFESRESVICEIHCQQMGWLLERLSERGRAELPFVEQLRLAIADVIELISMVPGREFVNYSLVLPSPYIEQVSEAREAYRSTIQGLVEAGIAAGELRAVDPRMFTFSLLGSANWARSWYQPEGPLTPDEIATVMWGYFLDGVGGDRAHTRPSR